MSLATAETVVRLWMARSWRRSKSASFRWSLWPRTVSWARSLRVRRVDRVRAGPGSVSFVSSARGSPPCPSAWEIGRVGSGGVGGVTGRISVDEIAGMPLVGVFAIAEKLLDKRQVRQRRRGPGRELDDRPVPGVRFLDPG